MTMSALQTPAGSLNLPAFPARKKTILMTRTNLIERTAPKLFTAAYTE
jgi:hypothetical protein